jgi:hypothetical protein
VPDLAGFIYQRSMNQRSAAGEERLAYQARIEEGDEDENLRQFLASKAEAGLQARIKELEDDNRALSVSNANIKASEQAANTENMRLKRNNDSLEGHVIALREHYDAGISHLYELANAAVQSRDAEIIKLKEQYGALTKENSDHVELASAESQSKDALISKLQKSLDDLTEEKSTMDANYGASMLSQDASIVRLESEKSTLAREIGDLRKELEQAKKIIPASRAAASPAPLSTPARTFQTPPSSSSFSRLTGQQRSSYPSPPMSGGSGSSVRNGASGFGSNGRLFGRSLNLVPTTPASAEQQKTANAFFPRPAPSSLLFGRGNPDDDHAWSDFVSDGDSMDADSERMDDNNDEPMGEDESTPTSPVDYHQPMEIEESQTMPLTMGKYTVTKPVNHIPEKKRTAAFVPDTSQPRMYGAAKESPGLIPDIGDALDEITNGPKEPEEAGSAPFRLDALKGSKATRQADPTKITDEDFDEFNAREEFKHTGQHYDDLNEELKKSRRAATMSAAPKGPKASRHAAEESSSRTGANGGVRKLANSNTAGPTTFAGHRSMQDPGQRSASTQGAD